LKTVDRIDRIHEAQVLNYLKANGYKVGLIVNFKNTRAEIKRLALGLPEKGDDGK
jgi:GxxExxY protein